MHQAFHKIIINTHGQNLYYFTREVQNWIIEEGLINGILNFSILHTSASLLIQENVDPNVLKDMKVFFDKLVPMHNNYTHSDEGKDGMPAHIKSALTNSNLSLSIKNKKLMLGIWQGIYLYEHRVHKRKRKLILHYIGE